MISEQKIFRTAFIYLSKNYTGVGLVPLTIEEIKLPKFLYAWKVYIGDGGLGAIERNTVGYIVISPFCDVIEDKITIERNYIMPKLELNLCEL